MSLFQLWIALKTLIRREVNRFARIWLQTLLPPAVTMALYFIIFGQLIGSQIGTVSGFSYMQYIVPGLIMMAVITNSYSNVTSSFYLGKFSRSIEEILISPLPPSFILIGFACGGLARGLCTAVVVTIVALFFTHLSVQHVGLMIFVVITTSLLFSLLGLTNAIYAKSFDDITIVPTFVLTPLTYFGGVFYTLKQLPPLFQKLSLINPILYIVNAFRFSMLGISDIPITHTVWVLVVVVAMVFILNLHLLKTSSGLRP